MKRRIVRIAGGIIGCILCVVLIWGAFDPWNDLDPFTKAEASAHLRAVSVFPANLKQITQNHSSGIYLPEDFPADNFEITVTGVRLSDEQVVDLTPSYQEIQPGQWIILEHLEDYAHVSVHMALRSGSVYVERTEILLDAKA